MINTMQIDGYLAVVKYDPEIEMFRGEFTFRHGGADFYAKDIESLRKEGEISLRVFHEMCLEDGIELQQKDSDRFKLQVSPKWQAEMVTRGASHLALAQSIQ